MVEKTPTEIFRERVRAVRTAKGWSQEELARRTGMHHATIANIEAGGRGTRARRVTLEDVFRVASALEVAVINLITPVDSDDHVIVSWWQGDQDPEHEDRGMTVEPWLVRRWVRGQQALPWMDQRFFFSQVPKDEFQQALHDFLDEQEKGR